MKFVIIFAIIFELISKYLKSRKKSDSVWEQENANKSWDDSSFAKGYKGLLLLGCFFGTLLCLDMGYIPEILLRIPKEFIIEYFDVLFYLFWTVIIFLIYRKELIREIQASKTYFEEKLGFSLLVLVFILIGSVVSSIILSKFDIVSQNEQMVNDSITSLSITAFLYVVILGPFVEEVIYRGILFRKICGEQNGRIRTIIAYTVTAFIFMLSHANIWELFLLGQFTDLFANIPIFIAGLGMSVIYKRTGNICYSVLIHMIMNFIAF